MNLFSSVSLAAFSFPYLLSSSLSSLPALPSFHLLPIKDRDKVLPNPFFWFTRQVWSEKLYEVFMVVSS